MDLNVPNKKLCLKSPMEFCVNNNLIMEGREVTKNEKT